jgi:hypothetical protein
MEMTAAGSSRKMRSKSAVVVLHMAAAIAVAATPRPNGSTTIRKPNSWLTSLFLCLSQISLKSLGLSLCLKCPSNLSSSSVLGFVAGGKRSKILWGNFQDLEVLFFGCWEVIDMNAAFCDSQMGLSRSGDDDDGGSAKICVLEVFFSGT